MVEGPLEDLITDWNSAAWLLRDKQVITCAALIDKPQVGVKIYYVQVGVFFTLLLRNSIVVLFIRVAP